MYSAFGFREFEIGDVDVVKHDGEYHLFHLVLPNHDYIAHAVSRDGLRWERVRNALFIGDPGAWDDDMLWTMHVSPDPHVEQGWRLFYTGLSLGERGRIQRVGMARSRDLHHWEKDESGSFPLEISNDHYESGLDEGRHWVSFRDPFCFEDSDGCYLLAAARVNHGPVIRRGCVALAREEEKDCFRLLPPLFHPGRYDDIEVPSVVALQGRYFLIGSTREDVKVHYWHSETLGGPYGNFSNNVLMPQGNYAARVCRDGDTCLIWNFFHYGQANERQNVLPPPKELVVNRGGELRLKSFRGFDDRVTASRRLDQLTPVRRLLQNPLASVVVKPGLLRLESPSGMEIFLLDGEFDCFRMAGRLSLAEAGKCGVVLRIDSEGNGYYLSLDLLRGLAQIRAWGAREGGEVEQAFEYRPLQRAYYRPENRPGGSFQFIGYEDYLEFSLDGHILLSLADGCFAKGAAGFYVEGAALEVHDPMVDLLSPVRDSFYSPGFAEEDEEATEAGGDSSTPL